MSTVTKDNFGPLIAYLVPGATVLVGFSVYSPALQTWLAATPPNAPTISGFLYLTMASLAAGMIVSAIRWAVIDRLFAWTGLALPPMDFSNLGAKVEAYQLLITIHYLHYQHHSNMLVATAIAYACYRSHLGLHGDWGWLDVGVGLLEILFLITSRDNLRKYYSRGTRLLGTV